jgi:hypothetical protein
MEGQAGRQAFSKAKQGKQVGRAGQAVIKGKASRQAFNAGKAGRHSAQGRQAEQSKQAGM